MIARTVLHRRGVTANPIHIAYGPPNKKAFDHISPELAKNLPTNPAYRDNMILKNDAWWAAMASQVLLRTKDERNG